MTIDNGVLLYLFFIFYNLIVTTIGEGGDCVISLNYKVFSENYVNDQIMESTYIIVKIFN